MTISERIFELIKERGFTQKEFSKRTGIAESTISDWKKKGTNPVSDKILIICKVLEVSPYFLLSGSEDAGAVTKPVKAAAKVKAPAKAKTTTATKTAEKKPVKKEEAPVAALPEIATIAKDDDDYHIRDIRDDVVKEKNKDKKKDKKKDKDALKEKKKDKKKDKGKDKDKKKKKKGYLITY